ncbi:glycosyltransferase family 4 protein [Alteromonas sp. H39]|uniref:glycosyltransferase family 4 protein n=1 Tax=Alteromonas sp. H39 TaxID=3389876 RepID=UPI0039DFFF17
MNVIHHTVQFCPPSQTFVENVVDGVAKKVDNICLLTHKLFSSTPHTIHDISFANNGLNEKIRQEYYKLRGYCHNTDFAKARTIVSQFQPDLVHCHFGTSAYFEYFLQKYTTNTVPMLISLHGYDVFLMDELYPDYRKVISTLSQRSDVLFTTPSKFLKDKFRTSVDISDDKIIVIPNSFDGSYFKDAFVPFNDGDLLRISNVGRFVDWKSQHYLIRAAEQLKQSGFTNFLIDFVGTGTELDNCKALAQELAVEDFCVFWGAVPHEKVAEIVGRSHMYVHTATSNDKGQTETFGVAILEAIAMLKPVIYFDFGGIKEIFGGKDFAYYEAADCDALDLASKIIKFSKKIGTESSGEMKLESSLILNRLSSEKNINEIVTSYDSLVKK